MIVRILHNHPSWNPSTRNHPVICRVTAAMPKCKWMKTNKMNVNVFACVLVFLLFEPRTEIFLNWLASSPTSLSMLFTKKESFYLSDMNSKVDIYWLISIFVDGINMYDKVPTLATLVFLWIEWVWIRGGFVLNRG